MITQEDIDVFSLYNEKEKEKIIYGRIEDKAKNLAYEFNVDTLYDLMVMIAEFGKSVSKEKYMKIAYEARREWENENY